VRCNCDSCYCRRVEILEEENLILKYQVEMLEEAFRSCSNGHLQVIKEVAFEFWDGALQFGKRMTAESFWSLKGVR
jgi:hypothetical protein